MTIYYVYEHWRPDKDICFYVGKGSKDRAYIMKPRNKQHIGIQKILSDLGMCVEIRLFASNLLEDEAFLLEQKMISFWRSLGVRIANFTSGGEGVSGYVFPEEIKLKIAETKSKKPHHFFGKKHSEETREIIKEKRKSQKFSAETRKKLSEASKKRPSFWRGKNLSEEHRLKIGESNKGKRRERKPKINFFLEKSQLT